MSRICETFQVSLDRGQKLEKKTNVTGTTLNSQLNELNEAEPKRRTEQTIS